MSALSNDMKAANTPPPFEPESIDDMRKRWPAILVTRFEAAAVEDGRQMNPVFLRAHIFDFHAGVRLIAAVEDTTPQFATVATYELHLSFGIPVDFQAAWVQRGKEAWLEFCRFIVELFRKFGMVTTDETSHEITDRAYHFWFLAPPHPYLKS